MRLWTLHPRHLDSRGLVALWREALLAKAVLQNRTRGYRSHPQLDRFRAYPRPVAAINRYLAEIHAEATRRGCRFDARKFRGPRAGGRITATRGQLAFEWRHLRRKLRVRAPALFRTTHGARPSAHPSFRLKAGPVADWERGS